MRVAGRSDGEMVHYKPAYFTEQVLRWDWPKPEPITKLNHYLVIHKADRTVPGCNRKEKGEKANRNYENKLEDKGNERRPTTSQRS